MDITLRPEILIRIQNDAILFGKIADAIKIKPVSLPIALKRKSAKLTQASALKVLREHLGVNDSILLNDESLTGA